MSGDIIELLIYHQPGVKPSLTLCPFGIPGYVAGHSLTPFVLVLVWCWQTLVVIIIIVMVSVTKTVSRAKKKEKKNICLEPHLSWCWFGITCTHEPTGSHCVGYHCNIKITVSQFIKSKYKKDLPLQASPWVFHCMGCRHWQYRT